MFRVFRNYFTVNGSRIRNIERGNEEGEIQGYYTLTNLKGCELFYKG